MKSRKEVRSVVWLSGINALFGIWMIISPWVLNFSHSQAATWSAVISGIVVLVLGAIRFFNGLSSSRPATRTAY
jgi:hypothetical protein